MKKAASSVKKGAKNKLKPLGLIFFGTEHSQYLESENLTCGPLTRILNQRIEALKLTAALFGACSLSANQVRLDQRFFIMARHPTEGVWLDQQEYDVQEFQLIVNPQIVGVSKTRQPGIEYCPSFPNIKANVQRYDKIKVSYLNEEMQEKLEDLEGFKARVFQHEFDHLNGFNILHKEVSEGEVEFIGPNTEENQEFKTALEEYSTIIHQLKIEKPELFKRDIGLKDANRAIGNRKELAKDGTSTNYWLRQTRLPEMIAPKEGQQFQRLLSIATANIQKSLEKAKNPS